MFVFERSAVLLALVAGACLPDDPRLAEARVPEPAETDTALYVDGAAPEGGDGTQARPLRSLAAAFSRAKSDAEFGRVIKLCAGDYAERELRLDFPVSLEGQYDCATWERRLGVTGFETRLLNAAPELSLATLWLAGEALGPEVLIEGLTVVGTEASKTATGVIVTDGASPTLRACVLDGGGSPEGAPPAPERMGAVNGFGSVALWVLGGHPRVLGSAIEGGHGVAAIQYDDNGDPKASTGAGSIGVFVEGGAVTLSDSRVDGGDGARNEAAGAAANTTVGSIAVYVRAPAAEPATLIERCVLDGGRGVGGAKQLSSLGLFVWGGGRVDASANLIDGGDGTGGERSQAARLGDRSRVRLVSNRIHGGTGAGPGFGPYGVELANGATVLLENNLIASAAGELPSGRYSLALSWFDVEAVVRHNTLIDSALKPRGGTLVGRTTRGSIVFENNLLQSALDFTLCQVAPPPALPVPPVVAFRSNALIHSFQSSVVAWTRASTCGSGVSPTTTVHGDVDSLEVALSAAGTVASGNFIVSYCGYPPRERCEQVDACSSQGQCVAALFTDWDTQGPGAFAVASADAPPGWSLSSLAPLAVTQGGLGAAELTSLSGVPSDDGRLATDPLGRARPAVKPSIGAQQWEGP